MVVEDGSVEEEVALAPAEACVTEILCCPNVRPEPDMEEIPIPDPPEASSRFPDVTTSPVEATVPLDIMESAVAS